MEFTDKILNDMLDKKQINEKISKYFYSMSCDEKLNKQRFLKLSNNINECLDLWVWDKYEENKVLDLQRVKRCNYNKWCPNCRKLSLSSAIHNFAPHFHELLSQGYNPYLLTLTVPNPYGKDLKDTIQKLNKSFRKFFQKLSQPVGVGEHGFKDRFICFDACLKVFEVTYNLQEDTYHPHFHCIIFSKEYDESMFIKDVKGRWSDKRQSYNYHSLLDFHLMKIWTMCFKDISFISKNWLKYDSYGLDKLYLVDIKEMNDKGIYEVFKYTYKDTDIVNLKVFKTLFMALDGQRIRQGHGLLFNVKVDGQTAEGEKQCIEEYLEVNKKEVPSQLLTKELTNLIKVYQPYRKISRFNAYSELPNIIE